MAMSVLLGRAKSAAKKGHPFLVSSSCPDGPPGSAVWGMTAAGTIRDQLRLRREKSTGVALGIFAVDLLLYVVATWGAIVWQSWLLGLVAGGAIAMLFVVGHDACHGSFTASRRLNGWIGRIAFLPSLTPFRSGELGHNQTHHVYTNLKPLDYVWMPFSREEFDALPWWRRGLERAYRTPLGVGLYYAVEIWGRRLIVPPTRRCVRDALLCVAFAAVMVGVAGKGVWAGV